MYAIYNLALMINIMTMRIVGVKSPVPYALVCGAMVLNAIALLVQTK